MSSLELMLRELRLGTVVRHAQEVAIRAEREGWSFTHYLHYLVEMELLEREQRRVHKRLKESGLPTGKTLATLEVARLPEPVRRQLPTLCEGHFLEQRHNILAFGPTGARQNPPALRHRPSPHRARLPGPLYACLQVGTALTQR
jgi:DNA replication protein DnaC